MRKIFKHAANAALKSPRFGILFVTGKKNVKVYMGDDHHLYIVGENSNYQVGRSIHNPYTPKWRRNDTGTIDMSPTKNQMIVHQWMPTGPKNKSSILGGLMIPRNWSNLYRLHHPRTTPLVRYTVRSRIILASDILKIREHQGVQHWALDSTYKYNTLVQ